MVETGKQSCAQVAASPFHSSTWSLAGPGFGEHEDCSVILAASSLAYTRSCLSCNIYLADCPRINFSVTTRFNWLIRHTLLNLTITYSIGAVRDDRCTEEDSRSHTIPGHLLYYFSIIAPAPAQRYRKSSQTSCHPPVVCLQIHLAPYNLFPVLVPNLTSDRR